MALLICKLLYYIETEKRAMQIIQKRLNDIRPYANNPRKNDEAVPLVANSIKEFGFKVPIVIDKDGIIVAGHTRYKAAKKLKLDEVPCIIADDLTEEQVRAYRLADNKVAEAAEWDFGLLGEEFENIFDIDMELFGFDFDFDEEPQEVIEDDYEPEVPTEPKAKLGDIYQLGNHRLMCGDSTSVTDVEKLLNANKMDVIYTDPPYGMNLDTDFSGMKNNLDFAKEKNFTEYTWTKWNELITQEIALINGIAKKEKHDAEVQKQK